ncbi:hypothetical protein SAMN06265360_10657 [Haloechinothrix alba]|uniref:DNA-binding phage zinc finger domain-containing protein n=1 Tax=Haloechinothrix alba TaxID=664784 RepID=A0A238WD66_9PSEU|nr:hypothetical protein [Haloechinothrix alba]SNR44526.1 hypothetical protein SAMN06265360_10657 [Haloechinothrix alba]
MSLTKDEVRRLVAVAMAYDNRNAGEAVVLAWSSAAELARWTYDEAIAAIHQHYAERTDFIQPGHITGIIRDRRRDAAMRRQLPASEPASSGTRERAMAEIRQALGTGAEQDAVQVACPACGAEPGQQCVRRDGSRDPLRTFHSSRHEALSIAT